MPSQPDAVVLMWKHVKHRCLTLLCPHGAVSIILSTRSLGKRGTSETPPVAHIKEFYRLHSACMHFICASVFFFAFRDLCCVLGYTPSISSTPLFLHTLALMLQYDISVCNVLAFLLLHWKNHKILMDTMFLYVYNFFFNTRFAFGLC